MMFPRWYTPPALTRYTGREIIARVAKLHDIEPEDITGSSRARLHCEARWQVMRELRAKGLSNPRIGRLLNRDHSSVMHGLRRAG
ncbi:MAG: hypothetical protein JNM03_10620 [Sphingopyxis sp.]|uniref:helix-turn-helix domain-containing protein n=1 Tax=Sphingopyxis sp. TaxID=1908224 RepID=UPI001A617C75|nr:helix-turn-helix domain-containing protein [Sphingopyxis sp.]MBL9070431.1 hypothetical protein [Sphingopyxis sp.]